MRVQTLLPQRLQSYVFNQYHNSGLGGGHHAHHRTWLRIKQDWWYPGMYNDIKNQCLACPACQARGTKFSCQTRDLKAIYSPEPGHTIGIDIVGPFRGGTLRRNRYLLVITDYLTKWAQSYPMAKANTTTTARHLMEWIYQMGPPCCLISDQGTNFLSATMNDVYDILGIYKAQTTAWHPQCNRNTE